MTNAHAAGQPGSLARAREAATTRHHVKPAIGLVPPPPPGLKARQLFHEARKASLEQISALQAAIQEVRDLAGAVVGAEEVYGHGLSALAATLAEDLFWKSKTLEMLSQRQRLEVERSSSGQA